MLRIAFIVFIIWLIINALQSYDADAHVPAPVQTTAQVEANGHVSQGHRAG